MRRLTPRSSAARRPVVAARRLRAGVAGDAADVTRPRGDEARGVEAHVAKHVRRVRCSDLLGRALCDAPSLILLAAAPLEATIGHPFTE